MKELGARQITVPPAPGSHNLPTQANESSSVGRRRERGVRTRVSNVRESVVDVVPLTPEHKAYIDVLRSLLVERLKLE